VHIPKDADEKAMQRALLQPHLPQYRELAAQRAPDRGRVGSSTAQSTRPGRAPAPSDSFES